MTTQNIFEPTLKYSQKTNVSNVNASMIVVNCLKPAPRIHVNIMSTCVAR